MDHSTAFLLLLSSSSALTLLLFLQSKEIPHSDPAPSLQGPPPPSDDGGDPVRAAKEASRRNFRERLRLMEEQCVKYRKEGR